MQNLPYLFVEPFLWWVWKAPKRIFVVLRRVLALVNHAISFTLNIRLLFVPLFGDYSIPGRLIGFVIRIGQIFFGLIAIFFLGCLMLLAPVLWFYLPIVLVSYLKFYFIFVVIVTYLLRIFFAKNTPRTEISSAGPKDYLKAVRPKGFALLKKVKQVDSFDPLLEVSTIKYLLQKTELDTPDFTSKLSLVPDLESWKILKRAFDTAKEHNCRYVEIEHIFYALLEVMPEIDKHLLSFGTTLADVKEALTWIVNERERLAKVFFWQEDYSLGKMGGFGRGMTGRVTPFLDSVSTDFTEQAKKGLIRGIIAHQKEIKQIADLLSGSQKVNVLIIGQPGSGKTSVIKGIAKSIMEGTEYAKIQNKRIVSIETGSLVAGAKSSGDIAEKFRKIMEEVHGSGDIILFFDEIHNLVSGVSNESSDISSVYSILEPYLSTGKIQVLAATNRETYRKYIEPNGAFARLFNIIDIEPSNAEETKDILKHLTFDIEKFEHALVTLPAIKRIVRLSEQLMFERVFPDKAVDVLNRCVQAVTREDRKVTAEKASEVISGMTHVPVTSMTEDESQKLIKIEETMKERVIGQDHAVTQVANALKRSRMGIRDEKKPIASFLFVGSTGVGKTETAKTLARVYFGAEEKMIRLDMSEYQQADSINKLIGTSDGVSKGILTEAVRTNPFSVILLDEIEKAHSQILLTFLQVLDDGRLTDSSGMTVSFANTIIIATSNVGTREIQSVAQRNGTFSEMEEAVMKKVQEHYAPEFLNRFSGVIVFNPLTKEDVKRIARILLKNVEKVAEGKDIKVSFTEELLELLVEKGFNPEWGARPLRRVIEDKVETYLAEKMLSGQVKPGDSLEIGGEVF
jgi:ATP-dependent Clp protease ATP-binding subunit ClpC